KQLFGERLFRLALDEQRQNMIAPAEAMKGGDLLIHPARLPRARRTDDDEKTRAAKRLDKTIVETTTRAHLGSVAEDFFEPPQCARARAVSLRNGARYSVGFERAMQPLGHFSVELRRLARLAETAVADKGVVNKLVARRVGGNVAFGRWAGRA